MLNVSVHSSVSLSLISPPIRRFFRRTVPDAKCTTNAKEFTNEKKQKKNVSVDPSPNHPSSPFPSHTHISPSTTALPSLGLCLDVRGYCSRRFRVQSFGHVFQVLIKLYDKKRLSSALCRLSCGAYKVRTRYSTRRRQAALWSTGVGHDCGLSPTNNTPRTHKQCNRRFRIRYSDSWVDAATRASDSHCPLPPSRRDRLPNRLDSLTRQRHLLPRASRALHLVVPLRGPVRGTRGNACLHRLGGGECRSDGTS